MNFCYYSCDSYWCNKMSTFSTFYPSLSLHHFLLYFFHSETRNRVQNSPVGWFLSPLLSSSLSLGQGWSKLKGNEHDYGEWFKGWVWNTKTSLSLSLSSFLFFDCDLCYRNEIYSVVSFSLPLFNSLFEKRDREKGMERKEWREVVIRKEICWIVN